MRLSSILKFRTSYLNNNRWKNIYWMINLTLGPHPLRMIKKLFWDGLKHLRLPPPPLPLPPLVEQQPPSPWIAKAAGAPPGGGPSEPLLPPPGAPSPTASARWTPPLLPALPRRRLPTRPRRRTRWRTAEWASGRRPARVRCRCACCCGAWPPRGGSASWRPTSAETTPCTSPHSPTTLRWLCYACTMYVCMYVCMYE